MVARLRCPQSFEGPQFISTVATGSAPFVVASTTLVANLNADKLDGYEASEFILAAGMTLSAGKVVYAGAGNTLKTETGFEYNETTDTLSVKVINATDGSSVFHSGTSNAFALRVTSIVNGVARFAVGATGADADVAGRFDIAWQDNIPRAQMNAYKNGSFCEVVFDGSPIKFNTLSGADVEFGGNIVCTQFKVFPQWGAMVLGNGISANDPDLVFAVATGKSGYFEFREGPDSSWPNRRWLIGMNSVKKCFFQAYDDAGSVIDDALVIDRESYVGGGLAVLKRTLVIDGNAGDEGGEFRLKAPSTNTTLNGGYIVFDLWQDHLRMFEMGSPYRGVFVDLTECASQSKLLHNGLTSIEMPSTFELFFGASGTNGTISIKRDGDDLVVYRREGGIYVEKNRITA